MGHSLTSYCCELPHQTSEVASSAEVFLEGDRHIEYTAARLRCFAFQTRSGALTVVALQEHQDTSYTSSIRSWQVGALQKSVCLDATDMS